LGITFFKQAELHSSARQVVENIESIAAAVAVHHQHAGKWFPDKDIHVFPDPFREEPQHFQGVNPQWLARDNNFGMVLQLVRFDPDPYGLIKQQLFSKPYLENDPYIRILLGYGASEQVALARLREIRLRLPENSMIRVDDHYYVVDLRRIIHGE
jgi:hypothetical protein